MPEGRRRNRKRRRPVKRERLAGVTVTIQNCNRPPYKCSVVMRQDGERIRAKYCRTKKEAEQVGQKWSIEAGNSGVQIAASISDADKRMLQQWKENLAPYGRTPGEAVAFYLAHLKRCRVSITVSELFQKVISLKRKERKSERYLADMQARLSRFSQDFGSRIAADVGGEELSSWLHNLEASPVTVNNYRRLISVLFSHATKMGACERNPIEAVDPIKEPSGEIGILTVEQARRLLETASEEPDILPAIAIGLFAGVRDAEIKRLDWRQVDLHGGYIEIKAGNAKSARRRLIQIQPALKAWLKPLARKSGSVWPEGERGRILHEAVRRKAGFGRPGTETSEEKAAGVDLDIWPHNALRHSFASYHLAHFKKSDELALELGHTGTALIFQHYRELVRPAEAERFWNLLP
jgi:integrase